MPFPRPQQFDQSDSELRMAFLDAVFELLMEVSESGTDPNGRPLFEEEMLPFLRDAAAEVQENFSALQFRASELQPEQIFPHGLAGDQLRFKLAATSMRERIYRQVGGAFNFRWLLDTLEGLLDSIIDASGAGGAVKEFKEAVRNSTAE